LHIFAIIIYDTPITLLFFNATTTDAFVVRPFLTSTFNTTRTISQKEEIHTYNKKKELSSTDLFDLSDREI
jgi:hypothetical protein